jgi:ubiquinone/menaquinone biosynthesis C-methylase UbiE
MPSSTFIATDGAGYESTMGRWSRRLAPLLAAFAGIDDGDEVLDVGCGTGHLAATVAAGGRARTVCAIDLAPAYIEFARTQYALSGVRFETGDACALPYREASFDRVLSLLMLHFVPHAAQAIAEMRRVARPGATVAAAVWDARGGFVANRIFFDTAAALDPAAAERRARNYTRPLTRPGELADAWRAASFEHVVETTLAIRMEFASVDDFWRPHTGREGPTADYVRSLDAAARERLRAALEADYLDGEADGPRSYAALAWAVKGVVPQAPSDSRPPPATTAGDAGA